MGLFVKGKLIAEGNVQKLSQQLFTESPYVIEAGVSQYSQKDAIVDTLSRIKGVTKVNVKDRLFEIDCTDDLTAEIARTIVDTGIGLTYLNKKEYGLDDIYYRYFEGGENHE